MYPSTSEQNSGIVLESPTPSTSIPEADAEEASSGPVVLVQATNAPSAIVDTCRSIKTLQKAAQGFGWETKLGYAKCFEEGAEYKGGEKAGQKREDVTLETLILIGRKRGKSRIRVVWQRKNDGKWAVYFRMLQGIMHQMSDAELKEYLASE